MKPYKYFFISTYIILWLQVRTDFCSWELSGVTEFVSRESLRLLPFLDSSLVVSGHAALAMTRPLDKAKHVARGQAEKRRPDEPGFSDR